MSVEADSQDNQQERHWRRVVIGLLTVIAFVLLTHGLRHAQAVALPLACAFFVTLLVFPLHLWLHHRLPRRIRWLSVVLTMLFLVLVFAAFVGGIWATIYYVSDGFPKYIDQLQQMGSQAVDWLRSKGVPISQDVLGPGGDDQGGQGQIVSMATSGMMSALGTAAALVLVFFLVLLMLLEAGDWRDKSSNVFVPTRAARVLDTMDSISRRVRQYLWVRTVVSAISGAATALWLWAMGVDFAIFWGLLTFLLNYVPNIGSIISVIPPVIMAIVQFNWGWALAVFAGLVAIEQFIGNFIDPRMQGAKQDVSPIVVLISVVFWGYVWGAVGALIAVPMTVTIVAICWHIPSLQPVAQLLSRDAVKPEYSLEHVHRTQAERRRQTRQ